MAVASQRVGYGVYRRRTRLPYPNRSNPMSERPRPPTEHQRRQNLKDVRDQDRARQQRYRQNLEAGVRMSLRGPLPVEFVPGMEALCAAILQNPELAPEWLLSGRVGEMPASPFTDDRATGSPLVLRDRVVQFGSFLTKQIEVNVIPGPGGTTLNRLLGEVRDPLREVYRALTAHARGR
jgi:hypothetical protein